MKNISKNIIIPMLGVLLVASCTQTIPYKDVVFFTGTENSPITSMYVDGPSAIGITITSSAKMNDDASVNIKINPQAIDEYNRANGTSYVMLPEGSYNLESTTFYIAKGKNVSVPVSLNIVSMDAFDEGVSYCLPLSIVETSNGMEVLEPSRNTFIVVNQIITTNGLDLGKNRNYVSFPTIINNAMFNNLSACTMEIRVLVHDWQYSNPYISSVIGVEENFLARFGDVSCDKNQLQYAGRGASITSASHFNAGQWYHIAVVDDGSTLTLYVDGNVEGTADSSGKQAINLAWDYMEGFHIGFSERGRLLNGIVSEARVWNRALNSIELVNNQCYVNPNSDGLIGYWRLEKLNEDGKFQDMTGNGNHGVPTYSPEWQEGIKCPVIE